MVEDLIGGRVGRTPLVRAHNLEKQMSISKIYLKLEGNNPSGHREDRMAYLIIRDALSRGKDTICLGTYGTVGGSLSFLAKYFNINLKFHVPDKFKVVRKDLLMEDGVEIIEFGKKYEECVGESRRVAKENGWYDANPGLENNLLNMYSFSYIAKEVHSQLDGQMNTILCQTSNGSSISGVHLGLKQLWVDEKIEYLPRIWAVSTDHGNAIIESFKRESPDILELDPNECSRSKYNRQMISEIAFSGQDALNAISDTSGRALGVTDEDLVRYGNQFKKLEKIKITLPNAFPIAALMKAAEKGEISNGLHVIVLNDGMMDLTIREINESDLQMPLKDFLSRLDDWLVQFTDPVEEMEEAVENAFDKGHILCALDRSIIVGVAIISRSAFDVFFPKYHLSYIATKKNVKGMGIATLLLQKAIEVTEGNFSLHVEVENKRAIRLYEKMGLRKKYYRMLYHGPPE
jgi:threonine synthase